MRLRNEQGHRRTKRRGSWLQNIIRKKLKDRHRSGTYFRRLFHIGPTIGARHGDPFAVSTYGEPGTTRPGILVGGDQFQVRTGHLMLQKQVGCLACKKSETEGSSGQLLDKKPVLGRVVHARVDEITPGRIDNDWWGRVISIFLGGSG